MPHTLPRTLLRLLFPALLLAGLLGTGLLRARALQTGRDNYEGKAVVINEVCTDNLTGLTDAAGLHSDWIELYNPTDHDLDLTGCTLTDDSDQPKKWQFPQGTSFRAGSYLLLWADGQDFMEEDGTLHTNFKLSNSGTVAMYDADLNEVDRLDYRDLGTDISYGRRLLDGQSAGRLPHTTPLQENPLDFVRKANPSADLGPVYFSAEGGYYEDGFSLQLATLTPGTLILYTLDGSTPDEESDCYLAPISLAADDGAPNRYASRGASLSDVFYPAYAYRYAPTPVPKAVTVTARLYSSGRLGQTVTSKTYWIGGARHSLPVVSVTADAGELFGPLGIYLPGSSYFTAAKYGLFGVGNYNAGEKIDANFQMFGADGTEMLADQCTLKVSGGSSITLSQQKNLRIQLRDSALTLDPAGSMEKFVLRGSGGYVQYQALHQDAFLNNYLYDQELGAQYNLPIALYLQGEYWGTYTLREAKDDDFFLRRFGVRDVTYYKAGDPSCENDIALLENIAALYTLPPEQRMARAEEFLDLDEYIRYSITQMYFYNTDGYYAAGNNTSLWRAEPTEDGNPYADGRWRYLLDDEDHTLGEVDGDPFSYLMRPLPEPEMRNSALSLFYALWESDEFKTRYVAECRSEMETLYAPENIVPAFDRWCELLRPELENDLARQEIELSPLAPLAQTLLGIDTVPSSLSPEEWEENVAKARDFLSRRADRMADYLDSYAG